MGYMDPDKAGQSCATKPCGTIAFDTARTGTQTGDSLTCTSKRQTCKEWKDSTLTHDLARAGGLYVYTTHGTPDNTLCAGKKCTVAADAAKCLDGTCAQIT